MSSGVSLIDILEAVPGVTAVIGGGGKSTLLATGGRGLAERGRRTLLATSTHMRPVAGVPLAGGAADAPGPDGGRGADPDARPAAATGSLPPLAQVGRIEEGTGKLIAPDAPWSELAARAEFVLVEADGSRGLPFKAHNEHEPVIPEGCARAVYVVGAQGFGRPVGDVVHRPQLFRQMTGCPLGAVATPELVALGIQTEALVGMPSDLIVVNQVEDDATWRCAQAFAQAVADVLVCPVYAGSLRTGRLVQLV